MSKSFDLKITMTMRAVFSTEQVHAIRGGTALVINVPPKKGKEELQASLREAFEKGDDALLEFYLKAGIREQVKDVLVDLFKTDEVVRNLSPVTLEITPRG